MTINNHFDEFWKAYPRKRSKADARKAWKQLNPDDDLFDVIMAAVASQRTWDDWTRERGRWIPYPATWLRGELWEDEEEVEIKDKAAESIEKWQADKRKEIGERFA